MFRTSQMPSAKSLQAVRNLRPGSRIADPALGDDLILTFEALRTPRKRAVLRPVGHLRALLEAARDGPEELVAEVKKYPEKITREAFEAARHKYTSSVGFKKQAALYVVRTACDPATYSVMSDDLCGVAFGRETPIDTQDIRTAAKRLRAVEFVGPDEKIENNEFTIRVCDLRRAQQPAGEAFPHSIAESQ